MIDSLFGLLLMGYEVVSVPTCTPYSNFRYFGFTTDVVIDTEYKLLVIYQQGHCQTT